MAQLIRFASPEASFYLDKFFNGSRYGSAQMQRTLISSSGLIHVETLIHDRNSLT